MHASMKTHLKPQPPLSKSMKIHLEPPPQLNMSMMLYLEPQLPLNQSNINPDRPVCQSLRPLFAGVLLLATNHMKSMVSEIDATGNETPIKAHKEINRDLQTRRKHVAKIMDKGMPFPGALNSSSSSTNIGVTPVLDAPPQAQVPA